MTSILQTSHAQLIAPIHMFLHEHSQFSTFTQILHIVYHIPMPVYHIRTFVDVVEKVFKLFLTCNIAARLLQQKCLLLGSNNPCKMKVSRVLSTLV